MPRQPLPSNNDGPKRPEYRPIRKLLLLEAAITLTLSGLLLWLLPFRVAMRFFGDAVDGQPLSTPAADPALLRIGRAVGIAARRLPWSPVCLPQAMAAAMMLHRRGIGSCLNFGAMPTPHTVQAHAWLSVEGDGGGVVCGMEEAARFTPLATFRRR